MTVSGNENLEESWMKFLPSELAIYRPTYTDDIEYMDSTTIILKNGDTTIINMETVDFEKLINEFGFKNKNQ